MPVPTPRCLPFPLRFTPRLGALEAEHVSRLSAIRSDFLRDAAEATSAGSIEAALDANGGWPVDQHFRLVHCRFLPVRKKNAERKGTIGSDVLPEVLSAFFCFSSFFSFPYARPYSPTRARRPSLGTVPLVPTLSYTEQQEENIDSNCRPTGSFLPLIIFFLFLAAAKKQRDHKVHESYKGREGSGYRGGRRRLGWVVRLERRRDETIKL